MWIEPLLTLAVAAWLVDIGMGSTGAFPNTFTHYAVLKILIYWILIAHVTIVSMSLCFHRMHTHKGAVLNPVVDFMMQVWLWLSTSMPKRDWVSVHAWHHSTSDTEHDPHSPVQNGFLHSFFLGALDYAKARKHPDVLKIREKIPTRVWERFIENNSLLGPIILATLFLIGFGPWYGTILLVLTFSVSPLFAIGGVNTLAHYWGYRNYSTTDNSRNVGFLFPLNWIIAGELDHNNHHAQPSSCSFRHKWYEFDVGYAYLRCLATLRLAQLKTIAKKKQKQPT